MSLMEGQGAHVNSGQGTMYAGAGFPTWRAQHVGGTSRNLGAAEQRPRGFSRVTDLGSAPRERKGLGTGRHAFFPSHPIVTPRLGSLGSARRDRPVGGGSVPPAHLLVISTRPFLPCMAAKPKDPHRGNKKNKGAPLLSASGIGYSVNSEAGHQRSRYAIGLFHGQVSQTAVPSLKAQACLFSVEIALYGGLTLVSVRGLLSTASLAVSFLSTGLLFLLGAVLLERSMPWVRG